MTWKDGILSIFASVFLIHLLSWEIKELSYRLAAWKAGCSMPTRYFHWDPFFGFDLFVKRFKVINRGDPEESDGAIVKAYGKTV
jgi:hypothetical protein